MMDESRFVLRVIRQIEIAAPPAVVFQSLLEQMGHGWVLPDGTPQPMTLEPYPGGRWFRDLGHNAGHLWGNVQVIKPPKLLEVTGPLFMSYAVAGHLQFRVEALGDSTRLVISQEAIGDIRPEHRVGVCGGWEAVLRFISERASRCLPGVHR